MKVGDYVRTNIGIGKIINVYALDNVEIDYGNPVGYFDSNWVIKASDKPIELIKEGDYVNGGLVEVVNNDYLIVALPDYEEWQTIRNDEIKSIVTKEQFERLEYKIKE